MAFTDSNDYPDYLLASTEISITSSPDEHICVTWNHTSLESFQTCIREQALSQLRYMTPTQANIFTFIYACISLLGVLGNGLVIFVVVRRAEMRTTRNVFIVNLAVSNFLLAFILVPFLWLPTYRFEFPYGAFMCKVAQAFPSTNIICSTLTVSVISIDRYFAIVRTRAGPETMKSLQVSLVTAAIWILSFSLSILYLLHYNIKDYMLPIEYIPSTVHVDPSNDHILLFQRCELQPQPCLHLEDLARDDSAKMCYKYYNTAVTGIMAVFIYIVPMPALVIFSCLLTRFLAKNERHQSLLRNRVQSVPAKKISRPNTSGSADYSPRAPPIPVSTSKDNPSKRRRNRTTALLFAMAFGNAILWLPFTVISLFIELGPNEMKNRIHDELRQLDDGAKLISMLSICLNPFLYGYLNTNFQREFKRIFKHCVPCLRPGASTKNAILLLPVTRHFGHDARDFDSTATVYVQRKYSVRNSPP